MPANLLIGVFVPTEDIADSLHQLFTQQSFIVSWNHSPTAFVDWVTDNRHRIDCLVLEASQEASEALAELKQRDILLPVLAIATLASLSGEQLETAYHSAIAVAKSHQLNDIEPVIRQAVSRYIALPTVSQWPSPVAPAAPDEASGVQDKQQFLLTLQQQRLAEKLRERLGYVGVYYKRNSKNFLRNLDPQEKQAFLDKLREDYRQIILSYFSDGPDINQKIDDFVNVAFFADVSVPRIVEIHMELIDDFSKQLHLEGRSDDILTDYRLTLIDIIAHLCEMYRRSIPREV